jgi:thiol-disulfide isomerase/thioredoxin
MKKQLLLCLTSLVTVTVFSQQLPSLIVGEPAPPFAVEKWIKGGGFSQLEKGKVYVIDLWATWCVPCLAGMPHLSKLQEKYKDKGLQVIGITSEDKWENTFENAARMVKRKDSIIKYNIAWVPASMDKDSTKGIFVHPWMQQAQTMNLPTAFLIDRDGKIAFIGDPHTIDNALEAVINNNHDLAKLKTSYTKALWAEQLMKQFSVAVDSNDVEKAVTLGNKILGISSAKPNTFLSVAAKVSSLKNADNRILDIGLAAARKGVVLTQFESPGFLDVLASMYVAKGDLPQAIIAEKLAVSLSEGGMKENQQKNLDKYLELLKKESN